VNNRFASSSRREQIGLSDRHSRILPLVMCSVFWIFPISILSGGHLLQAITVDSRLLDCSAPLQCESLGIFEIVRPVWL